MSSACYYDADVTSESISDSEILMIMFVDFSKVDITPNHLIIGGDGDLDRYRFWQQFS